MPLGHYSSGTSDTLNALLLGFGAIPPNVIRSDLSHLVAAIGAARRSGRRTRDMRVLDSIS